MDGLYGHVWLLRGGRRGCCHIPVTVPVPRAPGRGESNDALAIICCSKGHVAAIRPAGVMRRPQHRRAWMRVRARTGAQVAAVEGQPGDTKAAEAAPHLRGRGQLRGRARPAVAMEDEAGGDGG